MGCKDSLRKLFVGFCGEPGSEKRKEKEKQAWELGKKGGKAYLDRRNKQGRHAPVRGGGRRRY